MERHGYIQIMQYGEMKRIQYRVRDSMSEETTDKKYIYSPPKMAQDLKH